ncbi:MAG: tRNA (adenosine(37)-N6)-threonylcarbamoyltransferase complex ATPase subunit type 1 TsaE [Gelidibacter sp.]
MEIRYQIEDIESVAQQVLNALVSKTILLNGTMGVGKTTFVKALAKVLGSKDDVSSPTFSIVNEYELPNDMLYHFDMYRIKDEAEALQFGIEDYLSTNHWIIIEWPEIIPNLLPEKVDVIELILNNDHSRTLKLNKNKNLTDINMAKNCIH